MSNLIRCHDTTMIIRTKLDKRIQLFYLSPSACFYVTLNVEAALVCPKAELLIYPHDPHKN